MKLRFFRFKSLVLFCITFILSITTPLQTMALDFNGNSSGNKEPGTTASSYAVNTNGSALVGFRFSLVNASNIQRSNSVDIITHSNQSAHTNYKKFNIKKSKAYWVTRYALLPAIETSIDNTNFYHQSKLGFATLLPTISNLTDIDNLATNLDAWQSKTANINVILSLIGDTDVTTAEKLGSNKIIIEPLLSVGLEGGDDHVLTMTELAIYGGGYEYNGAWDTKPTPSSNQASWGFISKYTNRYFPNYMRTESADCNWKAAPELSAIASFKTIIENGYGAHVLSASSVGMYANAIGHWASGFTNGEGNNNQKTAYRLIPNTIFRADEGSKFTLGAERATTIPNGFELRSTFRTNAISGSWANYALGTAVTQASQAMGFDYWYDPIIYSISYNLDGGINHASNPDSYNVLYGVTLEAPTKEGYIFDGWRAKAGKGNIQIAASTHNYKDARVENNLQPGTTYTLSIGKAQATSGSPTAFSTLIYDFTDNKTLASSENNFGDDVSYSLTCPSSADPSHDIALIVYAGIVGSTSGIGVSFTNVVLEYDAIGINPGANATFPTADDLYSELSARTTGNITLEAKWTKSDDTTLSIDIDYVGNGATEGERWTEVFVSTESEIYTLSEDTGAFVRVETNETTGANTLFSLKGWEIDGNIYNFGEEIPSETLASLAETTPGRTNPVVTVYAYWDQYPVINASNRWFTLDDAKNNIITLEELMKTSSADDGDVGDKTDFSNGEGLFEFINFDAEEFKRFTTSGSVTVTCQAIDKAGNETYHTITIHIVDKFSSSFIPKTQFTRFVSQKYYKNSDGTYVAENAGGLNPYSIWMNDDEYEKLLSETLNNKQDKETGKWDTVYQTWTFTIEQISEVKAYIEEHGLGNSKESDALAKFYDLYKPK